MNVGGFERAFRSSEVDSEETITDFERMRILTTAVVKRVRTARMTLRTVNTCNIRLNALFIKIFSQ